MRRRTATAVIAFLAIVLTAAAADRAEAQRAPSNRPPDQWPGGMRGAPGTPQTLRWTEDWSDPDAFDTFPLEDLRHVEIGGDGAFLSLGGEARVYYTNWSHALLGRVSRDGNAPLQIRVRMIADLEVDETIRAFVELGDNRELGANRPTAPNRDALDVQQAFIDVGFRIGSARVTLRPGRFEMPLGNGKLVGLREGLNVRYTYQGLRGTYLLPGAVTVDLFDLRPVRLRPGGFDDGADRTRRLRGVYISVPPSALASTLGVDLYHYDFERAGIFLGTGGRDHRRNWGLRLWGATRMWDYDLETVRQSGRLNGRRIAARALLAEAGYHLSGGSWNPRIGARFNVFTGDRAATAHAQEGFVAPAPKFPLYSEGAFFALSNLIDFYPMLTIAPRRSLRVTAGPDFFWRQSKSDGVHLGPSGLAFDPVAGAERFAGKAFNLDAAWSPTRQLSLRLFETYLAPSAALRRAGARSGNYFGSYVDLKF